MNLKRNVLLSFSALFLFLFGFSLCYYFFYRPLFLSNSYDKEILSGLSLINTFEDSLFENENRYEKDDAIIKRHLWRKLSSDIYTDQKFVPDSIKSSLPEGLFPYVSNEGYRILVDVNIRQEKRLYLIEKGRRPLRLLWKVD